MADVARPPLQQEFQRAYRACLTCRKRKSRCELSAEDYAANKPCARCRRELKQCVFTAERPPRPGRRAQASPILDQALGAGQRRRVNRVGRQTPASRYPHPLSEGRITASHATTPKSAGSAGPFNGPSTSSPLASSNREGGSLNGDALVRTVVSSGHDALNLLFEAAHHGDGQHPNENQMDPPVYSGSPSTLQARSMQTPSASSYRSRVPDPTSDVLQVWNACRFVKMGWFSAGEAVYLVDM